MAYWQPDGIRAIAHRDGSIEFLITQDQHMRSQRVPPDGCVSIVEAAHILRPVRSRVAVQKWINKGKLEAIMSGGEWLITLSDLRRFAAKHGYGWADPAV